MHSVKQKMSDAAAAAKEHVDVLKAKAGEKTEMSTARTKEGKQIAKERRKAKEAEANMMLHQAKAQHAAEALHGKQHGLFGHNHYGPAGAAPVRHGHNYPTGVTVPTSNAAGAPGYGHYNTTGTTVPPANNVAAPTHNPLGGHRHHHRHMGLK